MHRSRAARAAGNAPSLPAWRSRWLATLTLVVTLRPSRKGSAALDTDLDQLPAGTRVLNSFDLGGWLAWRRPDLDRYIDGLAEAYSPEHFRGYIRTAAAEPGWRGVVRRWEPGWRSWSSPRRWRPGCRETAGCRSAPTPAMSSCRDRAVNSSRDMRTDSPRRPFNAGTIADVSDRVLRWFPLCLVAVGLVSFVRYAAEPLSDPDLWWHLRLGRELIAQRSLHAPLWSPFSDRSWVPTQPLTEVLMAQSERWFGLAGVAWLFGCALVGILLAVHHSCRTRGDGAAAAVATLLTMVGCTVALTPRPQLVSFFLLPLVVAAWIRTEQDGQDRWWLVPLLAGWSLCHGFWFVGVGLSAVAAVAVTVDRREGVRAAVRRLLVAALSLGLVGLSPAGPEVLAAPFRVHATARFISEWQRTDLTSGAAVTVGVLVLLPVAVHLVQRRAPSVLDAVLVVAAVFLAWYSQRTVALGALLVASVFTAALQSLLDRTDRLPTWETGRRSERVVLGAVAGGSLLMLALVVGPTSSSPRPPCRPASTPRCRPSRRTRGSSTPTRPAVGLPGGTPCSTVTSTGSPTPIPVTISPGTSR